jgi:hypothetical protein
MHAPITSFVITIDNSDVFDCYALLLFTKNILRIKTLKRRGRLSKAEIPATLTHKLRIKSSFTAQVTKKY